MSDKHLTPVIFLVFSNSKDDYLKNLIEEEKDILKSLQDHDDQGHIQVHRVAHTEIKDIFDDVNRYSERIAIFHYAGHAGDTYLQLQDDAGEEKKASVKGLAQLLGRQPALQLVFLNGCATRGWIERFVPEVDDPSTAAKLIVGQLLTGFVRHVFEPDRDPVAVGAECAEPVVVAVFGPGA